jgi:heptosyltransferase-1
MRNFQNILVIKWKSMGDLLFTLPAVHVLRHSFPKARITYMTSAENAGIAAGFTEVDEVLAVDRKVFKQGNPLVIAKAALGLMSRLRRGRFDLVLDLQIYAETAWMTWLCGAPERWGYQLGRRLRRLAYNRSIVRDDDRHPADANLQLLEFCGVTGPAQPLEAGFRLPDRGRAEALDFLAKHGVGDAERILFIQPFTSTPGKNWPLAGHAAVAEHWRARGLRVIFGGGPQERDALEGIRMAGFPVCAGMSLPSVSWVVERAAVVLGGDTGLLHVATAMGKRVVMLMGSFRSGACIPYRHSDWVLFAEAGRQIADLSVERVNEAISMALAERSASGELPNPAPQRGAAKVSGA